MNNIITSIISTTKLYTTKYKTYFNIDIKYNGI